MSYAMHLGYQMLMYVSYLCKLDIVLNFKSISLWEKFELYCLWGIGDQLFEFNCKFRYLAWYGTLTTRGLEKYSLNMEFLKDKTREITAGPYLLHLKYCYIRPFAHTEKLGLPQIFF